MNSALNLKWEVNAEVDENDQNEQAIYITAEGIGYVCGIHCADEVQITSEDVEILNHICQLHNQSLEIPLQWQPLHERRTDQTRMDGGIRL
jgi:predicted transport protein